MSIILAKQKFCLYNRFKSHELGLVVSNSNIVLITEHAIAYKTVVRKNPKRLHAEICIRTYNNNADADLGASMRKSVFKIQY